MTDGNRSKKSAVKLYLHDKCRMDPQIAHDERFYVSEEKNPEKSVVYASRSFTLLRTTQNYLSRVWRKSAKLQERQDLVKNRLKGETP